MDLLLIRHGQSNANKQRLLISNSEDQLSSLGKHQSETLKITLASMNIKPDLIYSSPWMRARQTAEILFDNPSDQIQFDERLAETNPGIFGTWKEEKFNGEYPDFNKDINNKYEGGESHLEMTARVGQWVSAVVSPDAAGSGMLCAVAHGGPISVMLQVLLGIPVESHYPSFTVPNASFTLLKWRSDKGRFCAERVGQT